MTIPHPYKGWRKSSYSSTNTNCVEVAVGDQVGVRDTKNRMAGHLTVSAAEWGALIAAVKGDQLDV